MSALYRRSSAIPMAGLQTSLSSPPFPPLPGLARAFPWSGLWARKSKSFGFALFRGYTNDHMCHVIAIQNKDFLAQKRSRSCDEGGKDKASTRDAGEVRAVVNGAAQSSRSSNGSDRLDDPDERLVWCGWLQVWLETGDRRWRAGGLGWCSPEEGRSFGG